MNVMYEVKDGEFAKQINQICDGGMRWKSDTT